MGDFRSVFREPTLDRRFHHDGFVVVDLFSHADIESLQRIFNRFSNCHPSGFSATILSEDLSYRLAVHTEVSRVLEMKVNAMLRDYRLVCAGFAVKKAPAGAMPVHRDISMVRPGLRPEISFWAPLVDVVPGTGCLDLLPGSHHLSHGPRWAGMTCAVTEQAAASLVPIPMSAGQALFLDGRTLHASGEYPRGEPRPVAVAPLAPREAGLVYYHRAHGSLETEEFEVDDEFYLTHRLGVRPTAHATTDPHGATRDASR